MPVRTAEAVWEGSLGKGSGQMRTHSGSFEKHYSAGSRFENDAGTNPEELIGAAHAGCFSMFLSLLIEQAGYKPLSIKTIARVHIDKAGDGFRITLIELATEGKAQGLSAEEFDVLAFRAKDGCPVSQALKNVPVQLSSRFLA